MSTTIPDQATTALQAPICVVCLGEQLDPATRETCKRCCGTGLDPDPAAPANVIPLPADPGGRDLRAAVLAQRMTRKGRAR